MPFTPGTPCWFEVTAPDIGATAEFYRGLFGWTAQDMGAEAGHYTRLSLEGAQVGGIVTARADDGSLKPAIWLPYFAVEDVAATAAASVADGGAVFLEPRDAFGELEFGILTDPDGAPYGITRLRTAPGTERWGQPDNPCWIEYGAVRAPAEALAHYGRVLGWSYGNAAWETATENPYQAITVAGGHEFGGAHRVTPGEPAPFWGTTIRVSDADKVAARAVELGGCVIQEPQDLPGPSRVGVLADQAGAIFGIMAVG